MMRRNDLKRSRKWPACDSLHCNAGLQGDASALALCRLFLRGWCGTGKRYPYMYIFVHIRTYMGNFSSRHFHRCHCPVGKTISVTKRHHAHRGGAPLPSGKDISVTKRHHAHIPSTCTRTGRCCWSQQRRHGHSRTPRRMCTRCTQPSC